MRRSADGGDPYTLVPPTVIWFILRCGWPTPTGTPWPDLPHMPMPVSSFAQRPWSAVAVIPPTTLFTDIMQPNTSLQHAIDSCYDLFAQYPRPLSLHASSLRNPAEILKTLTAAPLRELTGEQIGPYAGYAITTVGDVEDYKHFLPRVLEQAILQPIWMGTEPPIIGRRLKMAGWVDWPSSEQGSIRTLFIEAWSQSVQEHTDEVDAAEWICGIAILNLDVPLMLGKWLAEPSLNAALQLANFVATQSKFVFEDEVNERAYWSYLDEATLHTMRRWLLSGPVLRLLVTTHAQVTSTDQWLIDKALQRLVSLGRSSVQ